MTFGNDVVVHVPGLAGDDLGDGDAFVLRLVGEHRAGDDVADGVDAGDVGGVMPVDDDAAAIIARDPDAVEAEPFGVGNPSDRDQDGVGLDLLGRRRRPPARRSP